MHTFHRSLLLASLTLIFVLGLLIIFSTTSAEILDYDVHQDTRMGLIKQLSYAIIGLIGAFGIYKIGYKSLIKYSPYLFTLLSILLLFTLVPGIGRSVNGSRRWLSLLGFSFQPSEFMKYAGPLYIIYLLSKEKGVISFRTFMKLSAIISVPLLLIFLEPNNGTAGIVGLTFTILCIISRISFKYWVVPLLAALCIGGVLAYRHPYVSARLKVYLNPELDLRGKGHQPYQAKIAVGSGEIFGKGPGKSLQKLSLPEAQNDYIAAIYAEEYGFLGISFLILLYMIVGYTGCYIAYHSLSLEGYYLASIITFLVCFQAFVNLGVVSGLLPSTGLNLPFFSQGGSSLIANLFAIGVLLNISKETSFQQINEFLREV